MAAYRLAGYQHGQIGVAKPDCLAIMARYDMGLKWPDKNNPLPTDILWGGGVRAGITWDGTFYRDMSRYAAGGPMFWSAYLKPGSGPGLKNGYWFNIGKGWCHLYNDDFAHLLTGAAPRLYWDTGKGDWRLVIEATAHVTHEKILVWQGSKPGGPDPTGDYLKLTGCDPAPRLTIEAVA